MAKIKDNDGTPVLYHEVGGRSYSFSVKNFNPDCYDWLCEVVGRQMDEIHSEAVYETEKRIKLNIRKALGII